MSTAVLTLLLAGVAGQAADSAAPSPRAQELIKEAIAAMKQVADPERSARLAPFAEAMARAGDLGAATEAARSIAREDYRDRALAAIDAVRQGRRTAPRTEWLLTLEIVGRLARRGEAEAARDVLARAAEDYVGNAPADRRNSALIGVALEQLRIGDRDAAARTLRLVTDAAAPNFVPDALARLVGRVAIFQAQAGDAAGVDASERRLRDTFPKLQTPLVRVATLAEIAQARARLGDRAKAEALLKEVEAINPVAAGHRKPDHLGAVRLGGARWALGDVNGARAAYRQALAEVDGRNRSAILREQARDGDIEGAVATAREQPEGRRGDAFWMIAQMVAQQGDVDGAVKVASAVEDAESRASALLAVAEAAADAGDFEGAARALGPIAEGKVTARGWFLRNVAELRVRLGDEPGALAMALKQADPGARATALLGVAEGIMRREQIEALKARLGVRG